VFLGLAAIGGTTLLAMGLAMRISKPIARLVASVHAFAKGAYERPIHAESRDEIGYLAHTFEQMRIALQRHIASLADEARRLEEANLCLQETQQQLIQHERLAVLGTMAARVAHEVNNPLAIIKTAIRIIRSQSHQGYPSTDNLQMIEEEINRIARIIQELLSVSRPAFTHEVVPVNAVLRSLQPLLTQVLHEKQIVFSLDLTPSSPYVRIASDQLKQVILNMVRNAEDAMPEGGECVMRTAHRGEDVEISLTDTGIGIPHEHLPKLFDPVFTTKALGSGFGLGLSVSYGIIRGANGRIEVESEVGKGSTFRVHLPIASGIEGG
jgi:two-component system NtrC family sensor kinase